MLRVDAIREQVLPAAEDHRVHEDPVLVDKIVLEEIAEQVGAAIDDELPARSLLEVRDLRSQVARQDRGVVPVGVLEGVRHHVFGHRVQLLGERAGGRRPERRPDLPRPAAEQQRLCGSELALVVDLVLTLLDAQRPGIAAVTVLVEAGPLDHAVERHERRHHEPHRSSLRAPWNRRR
jgi:hypothetical protein